MCFPSHTHTPTPSLSYFTHPHILTHLFQGSKHLVVKWWHSVDIWRHLVLLILLEYMCHHGYWIPNFWTAPDKIVRIKQVAIMEMVCVPWKLQCNLQYLQFEYSNKSVTPILSILCPTTSTHSQGLQDYQPVYHLDIYTHNYMHAYTKYYALCICIFTHIICT